MTEKILEYIARFLALLLVLPIHEFAHGLIAVKSGDITPKLCGRYTLNPLAHFDALGLCCFMFAGFGWAKPMPVNPNNFNHYKRGCFGVAIAGVVANFLLAFIAYPLIILVLLYVPAFGYYTDVLFLTILNVYSFSLAFFVFNLLPLYPLDGFRMVDVFSKKRSKIYWFLRNYGTYILYFFFALSIFTDITGIYTIDILGNFISFVSGYLSIPITMFWGLIF